MGRPRRRLARDRGGARGDPDGTRITFAAVDRDLSTRLSAGPRRLKQTLPRRLVAAGRDLAPGPDQRQAKEPGIGEEPLDDLLVGHSQIAEAGVPVGAASLVEEGPRTEPLDEPAELPGGDRLLPEVDEVDPD